MDKITELLSTLTIEELRTIPNLVKAQIKVAKEVKRQEVIDSIKAKALELNSLDRRIYNNKEIASLLNIKEYFVSAVLKEAKQDEV